MFTAFQLDDFATYVKHGCHDAALNRSFPIRGADLALSGKRRTDSNHTGKYIVSAATTDWFRLVLSSTMVNLTPLVAGEHCKTIIATGRLAMDPLDYGTLYQTLTGTAARWGDQTAYGVPPMAGRAYHSRGKDYSWAET